MLMETWGVSLTCRQACLRGLPVKTGRRGRGGNMKIQCFLEVVFPPFLYAHHLVRTNFQPFPIIILICTYFPMEHVYAIYYFSPYPFCYIVYILFFVCRVWRILPNYLMNIFIIKKLYNPSLIKRILCHQSDIC